VPGRESEQKKAAFLNLVGPEYFETAGMRLLQGRTIVRTDNGTSEPIAVVNETLAQLMAADGNVVGLCVPFQRQIKAGGCTSIVGVVEARRHRYLDDEAVPLVFRPWAQAPTGIPFGIPVVLIQTYGDPAEHAAAVRGALQGLRDDLPYVTVRPLTDILRSKVQPFQLGATVFSVFGILSLALAAIGLYGVLGSFVSELIAEIGVRRAVGAPARAIVGLVVRQSLVPLGAGLILGMLLALAGTRYLASLLFGIEPWDPFSFTAAAVCLTCVALLAAFIPAWRAAHVDALIALRHE
jgi:hypothetical protein